MLQATRNLQELQAKQQRDKRICDGTATAEEIAADRAEHAADETGTETLRLRALAAGSAASSVQAAALAMDLDKRDKLGVRKAVDDLSDEEVMSRSGGKWACLDKLDSGDNKDMPVAA